ncbi:MULTISPECIES: CPBP family intramembrane glutamic endopeptidase [Photorhabdus]|uniref:CPBP family intramembrane glutamic endopeptidase n=1 Tax=Photorhabdus TaxID=29487 RepID=UPI000DCF2567|nr:MULTISPECIES: CPBP family intramembrane glutamic endopeptidase [Photorhabdus]AXG42070.1 CPBP family intramembrane metalloprotease domain-containing protein [Photorhabdus laumondii subsp. laumondii]NDL16831.1 CPBP family intramembrane metalloprotease [Photorhabdus laumondii subsp. laumondii]NDL48561.1 CPBP family intramembrane metalloprotease [Photorhabdus laumondii subsp. laumondii]NDL53107.1 CPBP family intramembrane metalloprotease [Photorhabdus laumondii subsp. laumondii]RAW84551.1 CPBP 
MIWGLLTTSLALLAIHRTTALIVLLAAVITGFVTQTVIYPAVATIAIIFLLGALRIHFQQNNIIKITTELLLLAFAVALFLHLLPGFNNLKYLDKVQAGPHSAPFSMYFNFDKALIPFLLLCCMPSLFTTKPLTKIRPYAWIILAIAIPVLLSIATALGGLAVELHMPQWLPMFILANIFFVSLAEEALFRGYIQQRLSQWINPYFALIITALIFGGAHFAGGPLLMIFAALAGLIYGLAWMWSGRLWVSVGFHFALNLVHLLFFTYPIKLVTAL